MIVEGVEATFAVIAKLSHFLLQTDTHSALPFAPKSLRYKKAVPVHIDESCGHRRMLVWIKRLIQCEKTVLSNQAVKSNNVFEQAWKSEFSKSEVSKIFSGKVGKSWYFPYFSLIQRSSL